MKKQLIIGFLLILSLSIMAMTQSIFGKNDDDWKKIDVLEQEGLPESAGKEVEKLLKKAISQKDNEQIIKALIYKNKYKVNIDNEDNEGLIYDLQKRISETKDVSEKSLLHSMLADLYFGYYYQNRWQINGRTPLEGEIPADMKEWTSNIFYDKIIEHLDLSVANSAELQKQTTAKFPEIIQEGTNSKEYYPTLYDFLMKRAINSAKSLGGEARRESDIESSTGLTPEQLALPAKEYVKLDIKNQKDIKNLAFTYYQQYLKYQLNKGTNTALMFSEIEKFNILTSSISSFDGKKAIEKLLDTYKNDEASVEIVPTYVGAIYDRHDNNEDKSSSYNVVKDYIAKYPNYKRISVLKDIIANMEEPSINILTQSLYYPGKEIEVSVMHKNAQSLEASSAFALFKIIQQKTTDTEGKVEHIKDLTPEMISKLSYIADTIKFELGDLPTGQYRLAYIANMRSFDSMDNKLEKATSESNVKDFVVSRLVSYHRNSAKDQYEIFVVDRMTGEPKSGVSITVGQGDMDENGKPESIAAKLTTDKLGLATFIDKQSNDQNKYHYQRAMYTLSLGDDSALAPVALTNGSHNYAVMEDSDNKANNEPSLSLFTDRSIYRPGQSVFFKGIVADKNSKVLPNKKYVATLHNSRGEKVSELNVVTNDFGSVAGNFTLPQSGMLGHYYVQLGTASVYFQVAEYKRPTFEITFDKIEGTYSFDEEVTMTGTVKTFSGVSLQDVEVSYDITRRDAFPFYHRAMAGVSMFDNGTVKTDANGKFSITFVPKSADSKTGLLRIKDRNIFTFSVNTTVTDASGETQSNSNSINVGNISMAIDISMPSQIEKSDTTKIEIKANNLQGQPIETKGSYKLYKLDDKDSIQSTVLTGNFSTGIQTELKEKLKTVESGKYRLEAKALDDKNREVEAKSDVILFAYNDQKPPIKTNAWLVQKNAKFDGKKPAEIIFGTSEKDSYILYSVYNNEKVFERRFIKMSEANQTFKLEYKAEYGTSIYLSFTSVKDGKFTNNNVLLSKVKEEEDTKLNIVLQTFRDKLRTGQNETWTIGVKDKSDKAASAELLASMYDVSLDQINSYMQWYINRPYKYERGILAADFNYSERYSHSYPQSIYLNLPNKSSESTFRPDLLNWFNYPTGYYGHDYYEPSFPSFGIDIAELSENQVVATARPSAVGGGAVRQRAAKKMVGGLKEEAMYEDAAPENSVTGGSEGETKPAPQIRQNFNETAFFFPQLRTNEKGETLVTFTVPESNTTWRFRVLAHDKNLRVGETEKTVVTSKELMVTPNMPRFIRQGDKTSISTKVSNLSENAIKGDVRIEFFDPITEKIIDLGIKDVKQGFEINSGASSTASWTFDVPAEGELIGCRIVAESANFSDGEQHALAILPNRMLVTESMPFDVTKSGESVFTFDKLADNKSNTLSNYKLTLEYASNPAWYAVLALPTMSNPSNENAVSWFASFYVNSLGSSIAKQYPKVSNMIKAWKQKGETKETLVSKLSKNEELKNILLEETPWVLDAKNESEQMERLSLLFDMNNTQELTKTAIEKLRELQTSNGGWMWYKGMGENRAVTQYIMYGLAELVHTGHIEYGQDVKEMQMRALKYMDSQIVKDWENLKKYDKNWEKITSISTSQLEYMYVRSFYRDVNPSHETREAERFYTSIVSKNWTKLDLYQKSLLAMLVKRNADSELATKITNSIREFAKVSDTHGMYWSNNKGNAFLSLSDISRHTFLMKSLKENGGTDAEMNLMKKWLVKQKQTQVWKSTHATIDAINALLSTGSDWFSGETVATIIKVGKKEIDTKDSELGTGYIKTSWDAQEIKNDLAKVTVTKPNTAMSYGAMYWQYYENLDKITAQGGDMNISKELYKKVKSDKGETLIPITESNPITIGDQIIVRLTIRAANNMEFVHLKDMRASCFEPANSLSGMQWNGGLAYYQTVKDASTNYFFDYLAKGTYVLEYSVYATRGGEYANGVTSLQCLYSPEFVSHTAGIKVNVKEK